MAVDDGWRWIGRERKKILGLGCGGFCGGKEGRTPRTANSFFKAQRRGLAQQLDAKARRRSAIPCYLFTPEMSAKCRLGRSRKEGWVKLFGGGIRIADRDDGLGRNDGSKMNLLGLGGSVSRVQIVLTDMEGTTAAKGLPMLRPICDTLGTGIS